MKIGIDIMGGDFAPKKTVHGAILAQRDLPDNTEIVLFGNKKDILFHLSSHNISKNLFDAFTNYAENNFEIKKDKTDIQLSKNRINTRLKSELATYLFDQEAGYYVSLPFDQDVQRAIKELEKN